MKRVSHLNLLVASIYFIVSVLISGCAGEKSRIVLLPGDHPGEVTVTNAQGSQVLNHSWQSVEIAGPHGRPESPVELDKTAVQDDFSEVLSAMPSSPVHYMIFFKLDSIEIMPESRLLLPEIAKTINNRHPAQLSIVGHTDTVDSVEYNYRLGLLRARTVAKLLTALGAAPVSVEITSRGKTDLLVKTPDQTLEPRNRRAEVTIR